MEGRGVMEGHFLFFCQIATNPTIHHPPSTDSAPARPPPSSPHDAVSDATRAYIGTSKVLHILTERSKVRGLYNYPYYMEMAQVGC